MFDTFVLLSTRLRPKLYNNNHLTLIEPNQVWLFDVAIPGDARIEDKSEYLASIKVIIDVIIFL